MPVQHGQHVRRKLQVALVHHRPGAVAARHADIGFEPYDGVGLRFCPGMHDPGDIEIATLTATALLNSMSGDLTVHGGPGASATARTMSGDVRGTGGLRLTVIWNTGIELLRASIICQRLTPTALPPVNRTHLVKEIRIIRDCQCSDRDLLQRGIIISFNQSEPLAQGHVRFR